MKNFAIIFLLLAVPAAIQSTPAYSGPGLGGAPNGPGNGPTNPLAGYLQTYLNLLSGNNGLLSGLGLNSQLSQLLNGLLGPKGSLTGIVSDGGQHSAGLQSLIGDVLNLVLGPKGLLSGLLGPGGLLSGLLGGKGGGTNAISGLLVALLGPNGLVSGLLGPHGLLGGLLSGGGGTGGVSNLLGSLLGPDGLVTHILNSLIGKNGLLGGGGGNVSGLLSGLLGPNGLVGKLLSTVGGLLKRVLGGSGGGLLSGLLGPNGLLGNLLGPHGLLGILGKLLGGRTIDWQSILKQLLSGDLTGGDGHTGGSIDWMGVIDNAMCQLQAQFPNQDLTQAETTCLNGVRSDLASGIQDIIMNPPSCNPLSAIPSGGVYSDLDNFVMCVQNAMSNSNRK